jgi:hypothetical protein
MTLSEEVVILNEIPKGDKGRRTDARRDQCIEPQDEGGRIASDRYFGPQGPSVLALASTLSRATTLASIAR